MNQNLLKPSKRNNDVEVMRQKSLNKLKKNLKSFYREFSKYNIHEISDQLVHSFIEHNHLDLNSIKNNFTEKYINSFKK